MSRNVSSGKFYRFDGLSILLVDDNRFVRTILAAILKGLGIGKVLQADNGEEATGLLEVTALTTGDARDVDVIFADHLMAPMGGLDLLRWVRGHESDRVRFLPFIMMSGEADREAVCNARDAGVTEYLAKPMSVINVASRLLAVIDKPRPFIRAPHYFGPDRRRQTLPYEGHDRRVLDADNIRVLDEGDHMVIETEPPPADSEGVQPAENQDERGLEAAG